MAKKVKIRIQRHIQAPHHNSYSRHIWCPLASAACFFVVKGNMDCGIITISTYMALCAPAQQHTGESLVFSQTDEACSRTIPNTIHMDFWGFVFCFFFFLLRLESRRTHVCANMVCLLTSAVLQDRNKLGDLDFPSDPGVRVAQFCCSRCAWNAVASQLSLHPWHQPPPNLCVSYYLGDILVPVFLLVNSLKL